MGAGKKKGETYYDATSVLEDDKEFRRQLEKAKEAFPSLVLISGEPLGKMFALKPPKIVIGRGKEADISLETAHISRRHSLVVIEGDQVWITDLGSTNGTFVNEVAVQKEEKKRLEDGDLIRCGKTVFKYVPRGNIELFYHEEMRDLANLDPLTQTYNKKYLFHYLDNEMKRSRRMDLPLCLLLLDVDHFKQINDSHGHAAGDSVLFEICHFIKKKVIRAQDVLGRFGGEEFAIILPQTTLEEACRVAERMRKGLEQHKFSYEEKLLRVTISVGVSWLHKTDTETARFFKRADQALYEAKASGRNCIKVG